MVRTDQQVVRDGSGGEARAQLGPPYGVFGVVIPEASLARQRPAVPREPLSAACQLGFAGESRQFRFAVAETEQQARVGVQFMLQLQLVPGRPCRERAIAGFAEEAAFGNQSQLAVHGHHAAIEGDFLPGQFEFIAQAGPVGKPDEQARRRTVTLRLDGVAKALGVLVEAGEADRDGLADRAGPVRVDASGVEAAQRKPDPATGLEVRLPGHDVHAAAGLAAAIQRGARPFQDLDAFDSRRITRTAEAASCIEAVHQVSAGPRSCPRGRRNCSGGPWTPRDRVRRKDA